MSKYIDAEKLIAELTKMQFDLNAVYRHPQSDSIIRAISLEYDDILSLIDSLQQEQKGLHFTPLNRLIQKIPSENWNDTVNNYARKLRDCLIKEGYRKDAEVLQDYISYMNGNNVPMATMDERGQSGVDLEKEILDWIGDEDSCKDGKWTWYECNKMIHRFYELGLNTKKEE